METRETLGAVRTCRKFRESMTSYINPQEFSLQYNYKPKSCASCVLLFSDRFHAAPRAPQFRHGNDDRTTGRDDGFRAGLQRWRHHGGERLRKSSSVVEHHTARKTTINR